MKQLFSASTALNKWLKADLPRLPVEQGKQAGVATIMSDRHTFSWQVHIIENRYQSFEKTIIATEAYSRFTLFIPIAFPLTQPELTGRLSMEWQYILVETILVQGLLARSDIAYLLSDLEQIDFNVDWFKNTDRSVNGHITDAGLWVTETLRDRGLERLSPELALDLAIHINTQTKRIKSRKEKFVPVLRLLEYCKQLTAKSADNEKEGKQKISHAENVISLKDYQR